MLDSRPTSKFPYFTSFVFSIENIHFSFNILLKNIHFIFLLFVPTFSATATAVWTERSKLKLTKVDVEASSESEHAYGSA